MHKVLLIWEEIPEKTKLYYFPSVSDEELSKMRLCQNRFINMVNDDETEEVNAALDWLNNWLEEKGSCLLDNSNPFECPANVTVILSGFLL